MVKGEGNRALIIERQELVETGGHMGGWAMACGTTTEYLTRHLTLPFHLVVSRATVFFFLSIDMLKLTKRFLYNI